MADDTLSNSDIAAINASTLAASNVDPSNITSNTLTVGSPIASGTTASSKDTTGAARTIYRFPPDIGTSSSDFRLPFIRFQPIKYQTNLKIIDNKTTASLAKSLGVSGGLVNQQRIPGSDSFYFPLPHAVTNSYSPSWEMADTVWITEFLKGANAVIGAYGNSSGAVNTTKAVGGAVIDTGIDAFKLALGGRFSQIFQGKVRNPKKQALFNGIDPRAFTFEFLFSPQSLHEAELVERLLNSFIGYTLPSESTDNMFFEFPYEWEISFHNVAGFPKIEPCVCTNISTNYGPNTLQLLQSGHSLQISLSLAFLETSLRTRSSPGVNND